MYVYVCMSLSLSLSLSVRACQACIQGKFKAAPSYEQPNCTICSVCQPNFQVVTECISTADITCDPCPVNSWFPTTRTELGLCYCNAGAELANVFFVTLASLDQQIQTTVFCVRIVHLKHLLMRRGSIPVKRARLFAIIL